MGQIESERYCDMELKELTEHVKIFLDIENIDEMSEKIMKKIKENDVKFYEDFIQLFDISVEDKADFLSDKDCK